MGFLHAIRARQAHYALWIMPQMRRMEMRRYRVMVDGWTRLVITLLLLGESSPGPL